MGFLKNFFANTRKPQGFLGKIMLSGMNLGHAVCADWGMGHVRNLSPGAGWPGRQRWFWQLHCIIFQKEWLSALSTPVL